MHVFHRFSPKNTTSPQNTIFFHSHHWVDLRKWCVFGVLWWFWCVFVSPKSTGKHHIQSKMVFFRGFMVDSRHLCAMVAASTKQDTIREKRAIRAALKRVGRIVGGLIDTGRRLHGLAGGESIWGGPHLFLAGIPRAARCPTQTAATTDCRTVIWPLPSAYGRPAKSNHERPIIAIDHV